MLTRLEIDGFKNLRSASVDFGPFTCIAGPNGVGKSNLFDAIEFLSLLAQHPIMEAAQRVRRSDDERSADPRDLFWTDGRARASTMRFAAEMIVPASVRDAFGREAHATILPALRTAAATGRSADGGGRGGPAAQRSSRARDPIRTDLGHVALRRGRAGHPAENHHRLSPGSGERAGAPARRAAGLKVRFAFVGEGTSDLALWPHLEEALATASGETGRRLKRVKKGFNENRRFLLERLDTDGPVSRLPAWQAMLGALKATLATIGVAPPG